MFPDILSLAISVCRELNEDEETQLLE